MRIFDDVRYQHLEGRMLAGVARLSRLQTMSVVSMESDWSPEMLAHTFSD